MVRFSIRYAMGQKTNISRWMWILLILGSVVTSQRGHAAIRHPHDRPSLEQIQTLEEEWRQAQLNEDVAAMDRLLCEDFLGTTASGKVVTKLQQLHGMRTRSFMLTQLRVKKYKIKLMENIAIVTTLAETDGSNNGSSLQGRFRYTWIYRRIGTSWRIASFESRKLSMPAVLIPAMHSQGRAGS